MYQDAIDILNEIEKREGLQQSEFLNIYHYKAILSMRLEKYPEALKYAKKVYHAFRKQEPTSQLLDALITLGYSSCWLGNFKSGYQYLDEAEQKLNKLTNISEKQHDLFEAMLYTSRNCGYMQEAKIDLLHKTAMKALNLIERLEDKFVLTQIYYQLGGFYTFYKIDIQLAIKYSQKCQVFAEELGNARLIALNLVTLGSIHVMTGDLNKALMYHEEALKKTDIIMIKMSIFNNFSMIYSQKGELEKALESLNKALELANQVKASYIIINTLGSMIEVLVLKGEFDLAKFHLISLREIAEKEQNVLAKLYAKFSEGIILKSKKRIQDRAKAQVIFEEIIQQDVISGELTMKALLNLCDLLVEEFQLTSELEVLDDLNPLLEKLISIAENLNSFWILAETYLLQAKFDLLKGDLIHARKKLTEAQNIAEKYNLRLLVSKISYEHDKILKNLKIWESFIEYDTPLAQRIELADLDEHIENMLLNRKVDLEISEEDPVIILIITQGGTPIFSHSFIKEKKFETQLISGFLTTIDYFIKETFSQGLDRAVFGNYTLLLKYLQPFYITYIFSGDSYYALQRIKYFTENLKTQQDIWGILLRNFEKGKSVHLEDIPVLETLISDIFIQRNVELNKLV